MVVGVNGVGKTTTIGKLANQFKILSHIDASGLTDKPLTSVHIRRGDYLSKSDYHKVQPIEYYQKAVILSEKIKKSWNGHPNRLIITAENDFFTKMKKATDVVAEILKKYY